jgi:hypothetical protein
MLGNSDFGKIGVHLKYITIERQVLSTQKNMKDSLE